MGQNLETKINILADASNARNEVGRFESAFSRAMREVGKTPAEIKSIRSLAKEIRNGAKSTEDLDKETRELVDTYNQLRTIADARHTLNIIPHDRIEKEIKEVQAAYEKLKRTGKLTETELAQAALKTQQKINELKADTNGWVESMETAKGSLASLAVSATGLTVAAKQAIDFESAMADVAKVANGTDEQMAALGKSIKEMSEEIPITAEGLAQIAAQGGQLGVPIERLGEFTQLAAKMGIAFNLSAEEAGDAVAKLSNIFELPIERVAYLGDAINTLGNNTAATEAKILEALSRIGGTSKQFGLAADQAAALAAAMIALGKPPQVAATAINALLSKLQTANVQGPEFKSALEGIGISAKQLAQDISSDPQTALINFLDTLKNLDKQSRAETLTRLFGQEYQDDISLLVGSLGQYGKALDLVAGKQGDVAGAMDKEFAARMKTADAQLELLKNSINNLAINLGSVFLPIITEVGGGLAEASNAIAGFVEQFPAISGMAATIGTVLPALAALKTGLKAISLAAAKGVAGAKAQLALLRTEISATAATVGKLNTAFNLFASITIGWEFGKWAREEFDIVKRAGNELARAITLLIAEFGGLAEITAAPFNDDTVVGAYDRLRDSLNEINKQYDDMNRYEFVEKAAGDARKAATVNDEVAESQKRLAEAHRGTKTAAEDLAASYEKLGVQSTAKIQKAEKEIIGAFRTIVGAADTTGRDVLAALDSALGKLGNADSINALQKTLEGAFVAGRISADEYAHALGRIQVKLDELDFGKLGVESAASAQKVEKEFIGAFEKIVKRADVTGTDIAASFNAALLKVSSADGIGRLADSIQKAFDEGKISATEFKREMAALEKRLIELQKIDLASAFNNGEISAAKYKQQLTELERQEVKLNKAALTRVQALEQERSATENASTSTGDHVDKLIKLAKAYREGSISAAEYWAQSKEIEATQQKASKSTKELSAATKEAASSFSEISSAISGAETVQDLENLKDVAKQSFGAGKISAREYERALGKIEEKTKQVKRVTRSLSVDMKAFAQTQGLAADEAEYFGKVYQKVFNEHLAGNQSRLNAIGRSISGWFNALKDVERGALQAAKGVASLDRELATLGSSGLSGVKDMQLRLLELSGTEEQVARARARREREQLAIELKRAKLEAAKQKALGNDSEASALRTEARYLKEQIALLGQIQAKETVNRVAENNRAASGAVKTQTIVFQSPRGQEVSGVFAENDAEKMLDVLKQAGAASQ